MTARPVTGVVLAAGASRRLGTPKQVLPYRDTTVLGATLDVARDVGFEQLIVTLGGAAEAVLDVVQMDGADVVTVDDYGTGCSASLRVALERVDPQAAGIVLMLGDQPQLAAETVRQVVATARRASNSPIMVCRYADGIGHPFWFSRDVFGELSQLHGDKGVWRLAQSGRYPVCEITVAGPVPLDVDTWDDYQQLLASVPS